MNLRGVVYFRAKRKQRLVSTLSTRVQGRETARLLVALLGHHGADAHQVFLLLDGAHEAEADEIRVGEPPDALRPLRVALDPVGVGRAPRGAATLLGLVTRR